MRFGLVKDVFFPILEATLGHKEVRRGHLVTLAVLTFLDWDCLGVFSVRVFLNTEYRMIVNTT